MTLLRKPELSPEIVMRREMDALVVGAGFSGLYLLHQLRGLGLKTAVYERGADVGGTWYWNRYPGARCDIESFDYSYSFSEELQQEWRWSERYATQPEILRYINHVADRFDLRRDIRFKTQVVSATYDDTLGQWQILTNQGELVTARYFFLATGCLSCGNVPDIKGRDSFAGGVYHTGDWPHEGVNFTGKRVAVIGTGSSGIQSIPLIAEQAERVFVFQRTPNFSIPARNAPISPEYERDQKARYKERREIARYNSGGVYRIDTTVRAFEVSDAEREAVYQRKWEEGGLNFASAFADIRTDERANDSAADFIRGKIAETVHDPKVAELLTPSGYPFAAKRPCVDTDYYQTFNRENVTLVDIKANPITEITANCVITSDAAYDVDAIVFATGFDAMTGAINAIDIRGRDGASLAEHWSAGPRTYLGISSAGFPNMFIIASVGSPSVLSNMMTSIEQHVEWLTNCLRYMRDHQIETIEASADAEADWVKHLNELADATLFPQGSSWYMGANIPGKPRVFMAYVGGVGTYRKLCASIETSGYPGFIMRGKSSPRDASQATQARLLGAQGA